MLPTAGWAEGLYTGTSSGPNAWKQVWMAISRSSDLSVWSLVVDEGSMRPDQTSGVSGWLLCFPQCLDTIGCVTGNKYVHPHNTRTEMYAGRVACCPLVGHVEYALHVVLRLRQRRLINVRKNWGQTDGRHTVTLRLLLDAASVKKPVWLPKRFPLEQVE